MTYQEFIQAVQDQIRSMLPHTTVTTKRILKNNNLSLDGLLIQSPQSNVSPTIYLNYYYEKYTCGTSFDKILADILQCYEAHRKEQPMDLSFFTDYEKVKSNIIYRIVHRQRNEELLKDVPYLPYLDLAIVFYFLLDQPSSQEELASILIHHHHLAYWEVTSEDLFHLAKENTPNLLPHSFIPIQEVLSDMFYLEDTNNSLPLYILSNKYKIHGACCMLYPQLLQQISQEFDSDFLILPSSIHEVLLLPTKDLMPIDIEEYNSFVTQVNENSVAQEEVLSDHVYYYSKEANSISLPSQALLA